VIVKHPKIQGGKTMYGRSKKKLTLKVFVILLSFAMTTAGFSANAGSARIIPSGKVSIIKDGRVVGEFSKESPLPEGTILRCEAKCAVKLDDAYMIAEPDTVFSVSPMANSNELLVQKGTVYFSISESSRPLTFNTPAGNATSGELSLNDGELRGYVRATGNKTELGVIGGGSMMVKTESGEMAISSGKQVTMTLAEPEKSVAATGTTGGMTGNQKLAIGAVAAGVLTAGVVAFASSSSSSNGGGGGGSPSSP
jgi:hypothetical protein